MHRPTMISALENFSGEWDICIIGGGATGLGTAVDAASRGYKTILLEQHDFAKGTSSRSTKLVHGGVRYLQQGNIKLVTEALHERGVLRKNAPHLVKNQSFIVPNYKWWEGPFYGIGLKVYDWMAGSLGLGASRLLSKEETLQLAPTLDEDGLRGGVLYHDGQFDDARLAINLAQTAAAQGAVLLNYMPVERLLKMNGHIAGVAARDKTTGKTFEIKSKAVINATGVFTDTILSMDEPNTETIISPSQGIHLVFDKSFLPGDAAILVPHTDDGRVLFAVPWHDKIIVGTTDTPMDVKNVEQLLEPVALEEEIDFVLKQISRYLSKDPSRKDIRSIFAGLRPLVKSSGKKTAEISRDHVITTSTSGLITITGGKWTTYRRMAEDAVDTAIVQQKLPFLPCKTNDLPIHGAFPVADFNAPLYYYGSDLPAVKALGAQQPNGSEILHERLPYRKEEIIWAVKEEMCMTVEDALCRRTRALLLDAAAAIDVSPIVASLMAKEMGKNESWINEQLHEFNAMARHYLPLQPHVTT